MLPKRFDARLTRPLDPRSRLKALMDSLPEPAVIEPLSAEVAATLFAPCGDCGLTTLSSSEDDLTCTCCGRCRRLREALGKTLAAVPSGAALYDETNPMWWAVDRLKEAGLTVEFTRPPVDATMVAIGYMPDGCPPSFAIIRESGVFRAAVTGTGICSKTDSQYLEEVVEFVLRIYREKGCLK